MFIILFVIKNSYLFIVKLDNNKKLKHFTSGLRHLDHTTKPLKRFKER